MFYKKIILMFFGLLIGISTAYAFEISAKSAILYEVSSGKILYQKDIHTKRPIASTTKIMTGILSLENIEDTERVITVAPESVGIEGTSLYLKQGEKISLNTLIHGLLLQSGNDAAIALAEYVSGNVSAFVTAMNLKAKSLGMMNTNFKNPHGLPDDEHYSTAYDMALLAAYAMNDGEFRNIVSEKSYSGDGRSFANHNKLLRMSERIDGVKTGFTKASGRCLVSSAEENGMRLVAVTLSAPDDWNDHLKLYEYGFGKFRKTVHFSEGEIIQNVPVISGCMRSVEAAVEDSVTEIAYQNAPNNSYPKVFLPRFVYAPVKKGDKIGEIQLIDGSSQEIIKKTDIIAKTACSVVSSENVFEKISGFFMKILTSKRELIS